MSENKEKVQGQEQIQGIIPADKVQGPIQAMTVLLQSVDLGRQAGVYGFNDLDSIAKSVKIVSQEINKEVANLQNVGKTYIHTEDKVEESDMSSVMSSTEDTVATKLMEADETFTFFNPWGQITLQKGDKFVIVGDNICVPIA